MDAVTSLELVTGSLILGGAAAARGVVVREQALAEGGRAYRLVLPAEFSDGAIEQFVNGLHGALRPALRRLTSGQPWVSVELHASESGLELRVWVSDAVGDEFVATQARAAFPGARLEPASDDVIDGVAAGGWVVGRGAGLLRTATPVPGLSLLATGLRGLGAGEQALLQILLTPQSPLAQAHMLRTADTLLAGKNTRDGARVPPTLADRARARRLQEKAARSLFGTSIRILCWAPDASAARRRAQAIASGLHAFATSELHLARRRAYSWKRFQRTVLQRRRGWVPAPFTLNSDEVSAMLAVTPVLVRELGLPATASRQLPPPAGVPTQGRVLGFATTASGDRPIAISVADSFRHLHLVAPTGTGKSEVITNLATQDMRAGHSVVVLDFKGDLYDQLVLRVPDERLDSLVLLDPSDTQFPVGLNVLEVRPGEDAERVCDDLVSTFHGLYAASWGPRTSDVLKASFLTLVRRPGSTLADLPRLLGDTAFRRPYLVDLDNPMLEWFWSWWESLSPAAQADIVASPGNKLRDLLLRGRIARMLSQTRSTVDFDDVLNRPGILLAKLSKGLNGEEETTLLGSLLVARIWQAARRRAAIPEADRVPAFVFIDEFQTVASLTTRFEEVLSTARSLKVGLTLAHQGMSQVSAELRKSITSNARSRLAFQMGADDARLLAREVAPYLTEADLRGLGRFEVACSVSVDGNTTRPFTAHTLPAPPPLRADADEVVEASRKRHARPRSEVDKELRRRFTSLPETPDLPKQFGRRKPTDRPTDRRNDDMAPRPQPGGRSGESRNDYPGPSR